MSKPKIEIQGTRYYLSLSAKQFDALMAGLDSASEASSYLTDDKGFSNYADVERLYGDLIEADRVAKEKRRKFKRAVSKLLSRDPKS